MELRRLYKKVKKPAKMFIKVLGRMFYPTAAPRYRDNNLAFMTCILKVKLNKRGRRGWQRSVIKLLKDCHGVRFQMDENGRVEVNGIGDPDKLLWKIGKSKKIELQWIQFGQCSSNLFLQQKSAKAKDPRLEEKPLPYTRLYPGPSRNNYPLPYIGYGYPPPIRQLPPY